VWDLKKPGERKLYIPSTKFDNSLSALALVTIFLSSWQHVLY